MCVCVCVSTHWWLLRTQDRPLGEHEAWAQNWGIGHLDSRSIHDRATWQCWGHLSLLAHQPWPNSRLYLKSHSCQGLRHLALDRKARPVLELGFLWRCRHTLFKKSHINIIPPFLTTPHLRFKYLYRFGPNCLIWETYCKPAWPWKSIILSFHFLEDLFICVVTTIKTLLQRLISISTFYIKPFFFDIYFS